ncbi:MAG TPA: glycosyl hydrolase [Cytophagales bacterium]|nr:glycosyl hydrolase [Cytophagales bacterium]
MIRPLILILFVLIQWEAIAQFRNIKLAEQQQGGKPMVEPSITINLKDSKNIVAAYSLDQIKYTKDGGETWSETTVTSPFGVYGDVVLESNSKGGLYFFHLSDPSGEGRSNEAWLDRIVAHQSDDGGKTWDEGVSIGYHASKDQDKPWAAVHPKKGNLIVTWTQFDKYASKDPQCQSNILMSSSSNGKKWSEPVQLNQVAGDCIDSDNTAEGAVPAIGLDGKVFVTWSHAGIIYLDRSFDEGNTWLRNDIPIEKQVGGWDLKIPGLSRCNGMPVLKVDNSPTRSKGVLYMLWSDQRNGENDTDVWFVRSVNHGDNWSIPVKVSKENSEKHQFLPWMTVDQTTGYIYVVYYDRRNYDDNRTDVYLSYSEDAGYTFKDVKISETPFVPSEDKFFGDYTNIAAHDGVIAAVWTRMDEGKTSIWTTIIHQDQLIEKISTQKKKK